jgi:hypothetical protein
MLPPGWMIDDGVSQSILGRPTHQHLGSLEAFDMAHDWISKCVQGQHRSCPPSKESELPSRVIDIKPSYEEEVAAISLHIASPGQRDHYIALSYCWGHAQTFFLTTENLDSLQVSIKLGDLPQTLQDAVYVTKRLGFRYLWIDALCILQDSEADKADQISRMQDIFRNATITISAERASDCRDGFLGPSKFGLEGEPKVISKKIQYHAVDETMGFIQFRKLPEHPAGVQPVHKRGWTYQEHFLSSRVLSFGNQLGWRCASGEDINCGSTSGHLNTPTAAASNPLYLAILDQPALEDQAWHRFFFPLREIGRRGGEERKDPQNGAWSLYSLYTLDVLKHSFQGWCLKDWMADHQNHGGIRVAIENDDLPELIRAVSPGLVFFFERFANESTLGVLDVELRSQLKSALRGKNGLDILDLAVKIVGRVLLGIFRKSDDIGFLIKDDKIRTQAWAAFEAGNAQMLIEAFIAGAVEEWGNSYAKTAFGNQLGVQTIKEEISASPRLKTLAKIIAMSAEKVGSIMNAKSAQLHWSKVVEEYSQRTLTNPEDRLPALSGIAAEFSGYFHGDYLAGIWESKVFEGLLWHQKTRFVYTEPTFSGEVAYSNHQLPREPYTAPSWSWASSSRSVFHADVADCPALSEFRGCNIRLKAEENVYGSVQEGILHLNCPLAKVDKTWFSNSWFGEKKVYPDSERSLAQMLESGLNPFDYETRHFWLARIFHQQRSTSYTSHGLILSEVGPDTFERVGYYNRSYTGATYYLGIAYIEHAIEDRAFEMREFQIV